MKLLAIVILIILVSSSHSTKKKKVWADIHTCVYDIFQSSNYTQEAKKIVRNICTKEGSEISKTSACQEYTKALIQNSGRPDQPISEKILKKYRECGKDCVDHGEIKKNSNNTKIAKAILDCSSNILTLSTMILGVIAVLIL